MCSYLTGFKRKFEVIMDVMGNKKLKYDPLNDPTKAKQPLPSIPLRSDTQSKCSWRRNKVPIEKENKLKKPGFNKGTGANCNFSRWFDRQTPESSFRLPEKEEYTKFLKAYNESEEKKTSMDLFTRFNKINSTATSFLKRESLSFENLNRIQETFTIEADITQEISENNSLAKQHKAYIFLDENYQNQRKVDFKEKQSIINNQLKDEIETLRNLTLTTTRKARDDLRNRITFTGILEIEPEPQIIQLTDEMEHYIHKLNLMGGSKTEKIVTVFRIDVLRGDLLTLLPGRWLNDNIMNVYFELLGAREGFIKSYVFTTFFYPKYVKEGYSNALKRWTRKIDVFSYELLLFPIHLGVHWTLAAADFKSKTIKYYDSLGSPNQKCLRLLLEYLTREYKERKGTEFPVHEWKVESVQDIPQQQNGCDCGMFTCKFAEYLSRGKDFSFSQEHMDLFRRRMIYEICHEKLIYP